MTDSLSIIQQYMDELQSTKETCVWCIRPIYQTNHIKKRTPPCCENCWNIRNSEAREELWERTRSYKPVICAVCKTEDGFSKESRFFYDNSNPFDFDKEPILDLVDEITDWDIIRTELDKCDVLCFTCMDMVEELQYMMGFETVKIKLCCDLKQGVLTKEQFNQQNEIQRSLFNKKTGEIYENLSKICVD